MCFYLYRSKKCRPDNVIWLAINYLVILMHTFSSLKEDWIFVLENGEFIETSDKLVWKILEIWISAYDFTFVSYLRRLAFKKMFNTLILKKVLCN